MCLKIFVILDLMTRPKIILFDLPTFPKGVIALSLPIVGTILEKYFELQIIDLNIDNFDLNEKLFNNVTMIGMKVSSQNSKLAKTYTQQIKSKYPNIIVLWGGEYPSLLPQECMQIADIVVEGLFEPVANQIAADLYQGTWQKHYKGTNNKLPEMMPKPDFSLLPKYEKYSTFMGLPLETSRGCTEHCMFCMVLVMQRKNYYLKPIEQIDAELKNYKNKFINLIDYNFGVNKEHVLKVSDTIKKSEALGWMAEMNLELLDDDEMLLAMSKSRCRMIYCGIESIDELVLSSFNKHVTNHVENYERIIKKVQSYGIQIAAGLILGTERTTKETFTKTLKFFSDMNIIYTKLTFLTYNPGTKVNDFMKKKGNYVTENTEEFDGVRMSYLPFEVEKEIVLEGFEFFVQRFYHPLAIVKRAFKSSNGPLSFMENILFPYCYSEAYKQTVENNFLFEKQNFQKLLLAKHKKPLKIKIAEKTLYWVRKLRKSL